MHQIFDCSLDDVALENISDLFVPRHDVYFFDGDEILNELLHSGIAVYTREEFGDSFPLFGLHYGVVYHLWMMSRPKDSYAISVHPSQLATLSNHVLQQLLAKQVEYGRGHIYDMEWLRQLGLPEKKTVSVKDEDFYFLTWDDWCGFSTGVRTQWIVKWLTRHRSEDAPGLSPRLLRNDSRVPYDLVEQYAGRFPRQHRANCFAAAIALAVGRGGPSHDLISEWLFQGPFLRLLHGQGYSKVSEYQEPGHVRFEPGDVLVWYTGDGIAGHAAYAVSDDSIFQKQGQGWTEPWQVLKFLDVWYNEYLKTGGYIEVHRKA